MRTAIFPLIGLFLLLTNAVYPQDTEKKLEPGQEKIKELSLMVGEWDVTNKDGKKSSMSIRLINNNSFLQLISGEYREITRWDLAENRFVTNAFGEAGGHGTFAWSKADDKVWQLRGKTPYYWSNGEAAETNLTLTFVNKDTMTYVGSVGDLKLDNTAHRRPSRPEPAASKAWRNFWLGDWHRISEWTVDGKTTKVTYDWTCIASGDANVAYGTTGSGYAITSAWMPDRAALIEVGHSSDADWEIVFQVENEQTISATSTGRMSDGRRGIGTNLIQRTGTNSYTAEAKIKLDDGSTVHVLDRNTRRTAADDISFGKPRELSDVVNRKDTWEQSVSGDGLSLYLASSRDGGHGSFDIYVATRPHTSAPWADVANVGPAINLASMDGSPDISADGLTLYYNSSRKDGLGQRDLWMSQRETVDHPWGRAVNLGEGINTDSFEGWPTVSSDGLELFFTSSRNTKNELFVALRSKVGDSWGTPRGLGIQGGTPDISPDGRYLFFANTSNWEDNEEGNFDIFVMKRGSRSEPFGKPVRLGSPVNSDDDDFSPNVSEDAKTLTFYSKGKIWEVPISLK